MADEPIDFRAMRRVIEQARLTIQLRDAIKFMLDFHDKQGEFMRTLDHDLTEADKLVSSTVGDATLMDFGIRLDTMTKVGDNMLTARGAFKAARDAMTTVRHTVEDSLTALLADINKASRNDSEG